MQSFKALSLTFGLPVEGSFKPEKRELLKRLHALFLERPIWSSLALLDRLQELKVALNELEGTLPRLAYTFRSGG